MQDPEKLRLQHEIAVHIEICTNMLYSRWKAWQVRQVRDGFK